MFNSFDCVKMTREIRDNFYKQKKDKSLNEFADLLTRDAHKSSLWKGLKIIAKSK